MTSRYCKILTGIGLCLGLWGLMLGCSSTPKRPAAVFTNKNQAAIQLELVQSEVDRGNYETALLLLEEARRLAVSVDDPSSLIREGLARGNVLSALGRDAEAEAVWDAALAEADLAGEAALAALVRLYKARRRILTDAAAPEEVLEQVHAEFGVLRDDGLSLALGWTVIGLAEKERRRWPEAEDALKKAIALHEKDNYLEQGAYDWYLIASVRSIAADYAGALQALDEAIALDRRAENTYGLGMDWRARGDVYKKMGKLAEAQRAYRRSAALFRSMNR
ncbi:MAG: tetratricopeptide repeat protein, partial [Spirochaetaceae bacterium]|nr:tetratricopeptide repeat protein [Spirochaetaceae bacterium]